ncbi:hypothetical protein SAMN03159496_00727 [Rhizobium sp. NFR07]|nr:hypothetical protein SAMN03159496_00727 [Rhizobium sp. NFR07]
MQLMDLAVLTMTFNRFGGEEVHRSNEDHRVLLRAFRLKDDLLAHSVMRTHILTASAILRRRTPGITRIGLAGDPCLGKHRLGPPAQCPRHASGANTAFRSGRISRRQGPN